MAIILVFIKHALAPLALYVFYMSLCIFFSEKSVLVSLADWSPAQVETIIGYQDARSLFSWMALTFLSVLLSALIIVVATRQLSRRLTAVPFFYLVLLFLAFTGVWTAYLIHESDNALRLLAFSYSRNYLHQIYEGEDLGSLFQKIELFSRLLTAVMFPAGVLGVLAVSSLLLTIPDHAALLPAAEPGKPARPAPVALNALLLEMPSVLADRTSRGGAAPEATGVSDRIVNDLKNRADAVRTLLLLGSGTLTFAVLFIYNWLIWPAEFFKNDSDKAMLAPIASGFTFYWGVGISLLIAAVYVPAMTQVKALSLKIAAAAGQTTHKDRMDWLEDRGITFVNPTGLREIALMLAPLLASPLGTVLQRTAGF